MDQGPNCDMPRRRSRVTNTICVLSSALVSTNHSVCSDNPTAVLSTAVLSDLMQARNPLHAIQKTDTRCSVRTILKSSIEECTCWHFCTRWNSCGADQTVTVRCKMKLYLLRSLNLFLHTCQQLNRGNSRRCLSQSTIEAHGEELRKFL